MVSTNRVVQTQGRRKKPFFERNRQRHVFLTPKDNAELDRVLMKRGESFAEWVRAMKNKCLSERLPESQAGDMRVQIDKERAQRLANYAFKEGNRLRESADDAYETGQDLIQRKTLRKKAATADDDGAWCAAIVEGAEYREHVIASGQKAPRIRRTQPREDQA